MCRNRMISRRRHFGKYYFINRQAYHFMQGGHRHGAHSLRHYFVYFHAGVVISKSIDRRWIAAPLKRTDSTIMPSNIEWVLAFADDAPKFLPAFISRTHHFAAYYFIAAPKVTWWYKICIFIFTDEGYFMSSLLIVINMIFCHRQHVMSSRPAAWYLLWNSIYSRRRYGPVSTLSSRHFHLAGARDEF